MKIVIQRVLKADVKVNSITTGAVDQALDEKFCLFDYSLSKIQSLGD